MLWTVIATKTSSVNHILFNHDCFTVISFNTLKVKRYGNKWNHKRSQRCSAWKKRDEGKHITYARNVTCHTLPDYQMYYEIKLKIEREVFSTCTNNSIH